MYMHAGKSTRDSRQIEQNQIVFAIFQLSWKQTVFRLVPNQMEDGEFSLFSVSLRWSRVDFPVCGLGTKFRWSRVDFSV